MDDLMRRIIEILEYEFRIKVHSGYLGDYQLKYPKSNEFFFNAGKVEVIELWKPGQPHAERSKLNASDYVYNSQLGQYILDWMRDRIQTWIDENPELKEKENFNQECRNRAKSTTVQFSYESFQTSDGNLEGMRESSSLEEAIEQIKDFPMSYVEVTAFFPLFDTYGFRKRQYPLFLFAEKEIEEIKKEINNNAICDINDFLFKTKYPNY